MVTKGDFSEFLVRCSHSDGTEEAAGTSGYKDPPEMDLLL